MTFTYEELQLIAIYKADSLPETIAAIRAMRAVPEPDETDLLNLTGSALAKPEQIDEAAFDERDLIPDTKGEGRGCPILFRPNGISVCFNDRLRLLGNRFLFCTISLLFQGYPVQKSGKQDAVKMNPVFSPLKSTNPLDDQEVSA